MKDRYLIRTYVEGDEVEFVRLFNRAYSKYAGFVARTEVYWLWCCRDRPDVEHNGIIVVEEKRNKKIVGYAVAGKSGNIWELCADPSDDRKQILSMLFERANEYLKKANAQQMVLNVPSDDLLVQEMCASEDFFELPVDQMFIGVTDFEALMKALTENAKEKLANFKQSITFEILNARSWVNPFFSVIIDDEIQVSPEPVSSETSIKVDSDVLTSILLGETDPLRAFLEGKLKIKPLHKIFKALKFLGTIRLHNSWFYSLADYG